MQTTTSIRSQSALGAKLKRLRLRLESVGDDTLVLKNVPSDQRHFSKPRTNVLIKRLSEGVPCVVCVDEDLEYTGSDPALVGAFATGRTQQGWRVLVFGGQLHDDLAATLDFALGFLTADEESAAVASAKTKSLLGVWAEDLTEAVRSGRTNPTLFRDEEVEQVATCVLRWQGRLPLILGAAGTGKTNLLQGVAGLLGPRGHRVVAVNVGAILSGTLFDSEREALLTSLLREAREPGVILAMEQAEWAVLGLPRGPLLLRDALDQGIRLIATSSPEHEDRFDVAPLESRLEIVRLEECSVGDACRVLESLRPKLTAHHGVAIDAEIERAAVERSLSMSGFLPGKAVGLLDAAAARASLTGSGAAGLVDIYLAASRAPE